VKNPYPLGITFFGGWIEGKTSTIFCRGRYGLDFHFAASSPDRRRDARHVLLFFSERGKKRRKRRVACLSPLAKEECHIRRSCSGGKKWKATTCTRRLGEKNRGIKSPAHSAVRRQRRKRKKEKEWLTFVQQIEGRESSSFQRGHEKRKKVYSSSQAKSHQEGVKDKKQPHLLTGKGSPRFSQE